MGLFDKLKTVLFEDEEEELVNVEHHEEKKPVKEETSMVEEPRFKSVKQEEVAPKEVPKEVHEEKSVFQSFDEEEFERIAAINRDRLLERDRKAREAKEYEERMKEREKEKERERERAKERQMHEATRKSPNLSVKADTEIGVIAKNYGFGTVDPTTTKKKFKPSPVISPVYGILDKNYRKEDILPRASETGTLPKVVDVDNVRKKAFGVLEDEIVQNEPLKDFHPVEEENTTLLNDLEEELTKTAEIRIADLEEHLDDVPEEVTPIEETIPEVKNEVKESTGSLEDDLFNLIDSMYDEKEK